ncbi:MAG: TetR/AcrR family transcriptional regulator [Chitinophagaceae bacterium]|nr:MAG: TetR/AcrR family transcriptional regulator [Chitinophagaceae bacterium]
MAKIYNGNFGYEKSFHSFVAEMKERIQKKADELFNRYGIRSVTMDEIATQLGMSKKTIYQYFSDKDELVDAVISGVIEYSRACCDKDRSESSNAIAEVFLAVDMMNEIFRNMNPGIMFDLERYHPKTFKRFIDHKNKFLFQTIRLNLERGIKEGYYRPEINVEIVARFRLESIMIVFNAQNFADGKFSLAQLHREVLDQFMFACASLKGYKLITKYKEERLKKDKQYEALPANKNK